MILDKPKYNHYDVIVVGSGPAGITTAMEIAKRSWARVALVESGGLELIEKIQTLSRVQLTGELQHDYFPMHTQRRFGGSSTIWGGFCATLEKRAFLAGAWPLDYAELQRWYPAAADIVELPEAVYRRSSVPIAGTADIVYRPFYLSPPVRFNEKFHSFIARHPDIHLILTKTCSRLLTEGGRVAAVDLLDSLDPAAAPLRLSADRFVLACGGMGNPRLMQLSGIAPQAPVGLGLMEHPHLYGVAKVYLDREKVMEVVEKNARVIHALQLSNAYCLDKGVLSFSVDFNLEHTVDRPLLGARNRMILTPVTVRAEMAPHPENQVSLNDGGPRGGSDTERDYLNQPRSRVAFNFNCEEPTATCWQLFTRALIQSGLGRSSTLAPELKPDGGGHLIGTTRMGVSARESVVDSNCKVHTTDNLYVAGSSVFPAGGASNPTYTIVALSLRLGAHLAATIKGGVDG